MEDITTLVKEERFVAVTHRSITKYLDENNQIHFRFHIKDKDAPAESSKAPSNPIDIATQKAKPSSTAASSKPKGPIRPTNLARKGSSIPMTGPSGAPKVTPPTNTTSLRSDWDYTSFVPKSDPVRPSVYIPQEQSQSVHEAPACLSKASSPT